MNTFLGESGGESDGGNSKKILFAALAIAVVAVLAVVGLLALRPSATVVEQQALEGAFREGSDEFALYTRRISAQTDVDRTTKAQTAMGKLVMSIGGTIRNFTGKTLTGLEIKVGVVDSFNNIVKEKSQIVIPNQREKLDNNQTSSVRVTIEGFEPDADLANIRWKVTAIKVE